MADMFPPRAIDYSLAALDTSTEGQQQINALIQVVKDLNRTQTKLVFALQKFGKMEL